MLRGLDPVPTAGERVFRVARDRGASSSLGERRAAPAVRQDPATPAGGARPLAWPAGLTSASRLSGLQGCLAQRERAASFPVSLNSQNASSSSLTPGT